MQEAYVASNDRGNPVAAALIGALSVTAVFAVLPLLQAIPNLIRPPEVIAPGTTTELPPAVVEHIPPPPEPTRSTPKPILEKKVEPIDLQQLQKLIALGDGGTEIIGNPFAQWVDPAAELQAIPWDKVDSKPKVVVAVNPVYPYSVRGVNAEVVVEFIIDANGRTRDLRIHSSTGRAFDQAALDAVRRSKWQPGKLNGQAVATIVRLPVIFRR